MESDRRPADDTEAIERTLALAVRYALDPSRLAASISANTLLTQNDPAIVAMTVAYGAVLGMLVRGHALNPQLSGKLMRLVNKGELPFHHITSDNLQPPRPGDLRGTSFASSRAAPRVSGAGSRLDPRSFEMSRGRWERER